MRAALRIRPFSADAAPAVRRHGPGDGIVALNVGGKTFRTLRSTVARNAVLSGHVARAEANAEVVAGEGGGGGIFVDRDPKHFGTILAYLRNAADGVYHRHPSPARRLSLFGGKGGDAGGCTRTAVRGEAARLSSATAVLLPKDAGTLTELYFESVHYDIPELTDRICQQQSLTRVFDLFGSNNPFQMATTFAVAGKRALVLLGGMLTGAGGWVYAQAAAAGAKTSEFMEGAGGSGSDMGAEFWRREAELWNAVVDRWRGNGGEEG